MGLRRLRQTAVTNNDNNNNNNNNNNNKKKKKKNEDSNNAYRNDRNFHRNSMPGQKKGSGRKKKKDR